MVKTFFPVKTIPYVDNCEVSEFCLVEKGGMAKWSKGNRAGFILDRTDVRQTHSLAKDFL